MGLGGKFLRLCWPFDEKLIHSQQYLQMGCNNLEDVKEAEALGDGGGSLRGFKRYLINCFLKGALLRSLFH